MLSLPMKYPSAAGSKVIKSVNHGKSHSFIEQGDICPTRVAIAVVTEVVHTVNTNIQYVFMLFLKCVL